MSTVEIRLEAIQSMLAAGHRSLHLERHTLLLWGGVGGMLCVATDHFINNDYFPDLHQHALALLLWLTFWIAGTAWLDQRLTRRVRQAREETLPFAQAQITRAWWMLMTMGVLGSCAMFFYGGGAMVFALWTVLLGLGMYLFGLFSRPLTEWIGIAIILLGVVGLATGLPLQTARWLTAACFAIGMPLVGWMAERNMGGTLLNRLLALALWLAVVALPPFWLAQLPATAPRTAENIQILKLPAGSIIPLKIDLDSDQIQIASDAALPIILNQPLEMVMHSGTADGRFRFDQKQWSKVSDGTLFLRTDRISTQVENGKPVIRVHAVFQHKESHQ